MTANEITRLTAINSYVEQINLFRKLCFKLLRNKLLVQMLKKNLYTYEVYKNS